MTNDLQMGGYAIDDCASFNCANIGGTGPSLSPTALNMEGKPIQYVSSLNNGGSGINFSTETLTGIAAINVAGTNTLAPTGVTTTGFTDSGSTAIHLASTYKGSTGTTAYTIGDIVTVLKTVGLLKP